MHRPILTLSKLRFKPPETSFRHWWISVARCRWLGTNQYHQMGTLTENGISPKRHFIFLYHQFAGTMLVSGRVFVGSCFCYVDESNKLKFLTYSSKFGILQRCSTWISGFINFEGFEVWFLLSFLPIESFTRWWFQRLLWIWLIFFRRIKSIHQLVQYSWIGIKKLDLFCLRWFFTDSSHRSRHHFSPPFGRIFLELFPSASVRVANPNSNHDLKTTLLRLNHSARLLGGSSQFLRG